jgi:hypothetical protein
MAGQSYVAADVVTETIDLASKIHFGEALLIPVDRSQDSSSLIDPCNCLLSKRSCVGAPSPFPKQVLQLFVGL